MPATVNEAKRKLAAGGMIVGFGVSHWRSVNIAKIARTSGYDFLFIDTEHTSMDLDTAAQICVASLETGVTPIVRVSGPEHFHAARILDNGAMGVVVPHVDTVAQAEAAVRHAKYPPAGKRSVTGGLSQLDFEAMSPAEQQTHVNDNTLVVVMLETPEAIANADAIAAVPGVDVVMIGAGDLSTELGIPGQAGDARIASAFETMIAACRRHGKYPGMGGVYQPEPSQRYVAMGVQFVLGGADLAFMMAGAKTRIDLLRAAAKG